MDISRIDYWATSGRSAVHKSTPLSKAFATAMVVASVIITRDLGILICLYLAVLATARLARLPLKSVIALSVFPALFAVLYAISQASAGWMWPAVIIMKALTAASAMVVLISTTPYADVINLIGRFLPNVIKDALFMTYRSFFILLDLFNRFMVALRLRGGLEARRLVSNAGNMSAGVGMLFIRAYDKSQMLYDVMSIRGYSGKLGAERELGRPGIYDLPYLLVTAAFLLLSILGGRPALAVGFLVVYAAGAEALRRWKK